MRTEFRALLALSVVMLVAGCGSSGPAIRADADPAADFSRYHTFGYFEPLATDKAGYSTLLSSRLKQATQRELEARGLTFDQAKADLLINFNVNVVEKTDVRSSPSMSAGYGYYGYRGGMYGAWGGYPYDVTTTNYRQGTLAIDAVDAERDALVWQGVAEGRISKEAMKNPAPAIDSAVAQIFARFPVTGASAPAGTQR